MNITTDDGILTDAPILMGSVEALEDGSCSFLVALDNAVQAKHARVVLDGGRLLWLRGYMTSAEACDPRVD